MTDQENKKTASDLLENFDRIPNNLKCFLCNEYLSVGPIICISEDGARNKCGRCQDVHTDINIRNWRCEQLALLCSFPCVNPGCQERLKWGTVAQHETYCPYKNVICPRCIDLGMVVNSADIYNMKSHFKKYHHYRIFSCGKIIIKNKSCVYNDIILLKDNYALYFVFILFKDEDVYVRVFSIKPALHPMKYRVSLILDDEGNDEARFTSKHAISQYDSKKFCLNCFNLKCEHHQPDFSQFIVIRKNIYNGTGTCNYFKFFINVFDTRITTNGELLRMSIECSVCGECMEPPIFHCETGHVVCRQCKENVNKKCPFCRRTILQTRCFALETVAENI